MLAARPRMVADFEADRTGFLGADLVRLPGEEWLDIVRWRSQDDFTASRAKGANLPGIAAFQQFLNLKKRREVNEVRRLECD